MGASEYSKAWKNCATCAHWGGKRQAAESGESVTVDHAAMGVCNGFWQGSRKYANDKCSEWAPWDALSG